MGGLGLRKIRVNNDALLVKLGWSLISESDSLWVRVIRAKYKFDSNNMLATLNSTGSSMVWRSIASVWHHVLSGIKWVIGNGTRVKFWLDVWIPNTGPLIALATAMVPEDLINKTVQYFVAAQGGWNWDRFQEYLPATVCLNIAGILPPNYEFGNDRLVWGASDNGIFSTNSAYSLINMNTYSITNGFWNLIWKWTGPQRIRTFLWLLARGSLLTNQQRCYRHLATDAACHFCGDIESDLNVVRDCERAKAFWVSFSPNVISADFFNFNKQDWLTKNLKDSQQIQGFPWLVIFGTGCWFLWFWRNKWLFDNQLSWPISPHEIVVDYVKWIFKSREIVGQVLVSPKVRSEQLISWSSPAPNWVRLNTDGAFKASSLSAAAGGVLRDCTGKWLGGFVHNIGRCTSMCAELWGVYSGLHLAWDLGYRRVELEVDSLVVINILSSSSNIQTFHSSLAWGIRNLLSLSRDWLFRIRHVYREGNRLGDWLANHAYSFGIGYTAFQTPPLGCFHILMEDIARTSFPRLVA